MEILNTKTCLKKIISNDDFAVWELNKIYKFYTRHKDYVVIIDGDMQ